MIPVRQVEDSEELEKLQELHDAVYEQARNWFQNLKIHFHEQILQHFGPMPEREADIQVNIQHPTSIYTDVPVSLHIIPRKVFPLQASLSNTKLIFFSRVVYLTVLLRTFALCWNIGG